MSEDVPTTNGVSGEDSSTMTNGEGEVKVTEEKSIMEMIAAGDFDAEESAGSDILNITNPNASDQPSGEEVNTEEEKVSEVLNEPVEVLGDEKPKEEVEEDKKEEQEAEATSATAGDEVGTGQFRFVSHD